MSSTDIISLVMSLVGVGSFCAVFTILFAKYAKSNIQETKEGKRDIELIDAEITEQDVKTKRMRKAASIAGNVIFYTFLAVIIPLFSVALINKIQGNLVGIGNESMLVVASGSMSYKNEANSSYLENEELRAQYDLDNQFARYDILFVSKVESEDDVHLYDVVAFYNTKATAIYIHRITKIDVGSDGTARYTTRGDANNANDPATISFAEIRGVYKGKKIQGLGMIVLFFQSPHGIITVLSVVYSIWMFNHFAGKIEKSEKERTKILSAIISDVDYGNRKKIASSFEETIRYGGYSYRFNEKGFLGKDDDSSSGDSSLTKTVLTPNGTVSSTYRMGEAPQLEGELEDSDRYDEEEAPLEEDLSDEEKDY